MSSVCGIVLAGGKSRRYGSPKQNIVIDGTTMMARTRALLQELLGEEPLPVLPDDRPGNGPLGGIETVLRVAPADRVLVVACDLPGLSTELLRLIAYHPADVDVVVPVSGGRRHPLCARWHRRCLPQVTAALDQGRRSVNRLLDELNVVEVDPAGAGLASDHALANVNAPADLTAFLEDRTR